MSLKKQRFQNVRVNTVADLPLIKDAIEDGDFIEILGYREAGDDGGQVVYYSPDATGTVDGGFIFAGLLDNSDHPDYLGEWDSGTTYFIGDFVSIYGQVYEATTGNINVIPHENPGTWSAATTTGRFLAVNKEILYAPKWGLQTDGTDVNPRFLTMALYLTGRTLRLDANKTYTVDDETNPFMTITGKSWFTFDLNGSTIKAENGRAVTSGQWLIQFNNCENFLVKNGTFDGNLPNRTPAEVTCHNLHFRSCRNWEVNNVTCLRSPVDGFYVDTFTDDDYDTYPFNGRFINCTASGCYRQGFSIINGRNLVIEGGEYSHTSGTLPMAGIDLEPDSLNISGFSSIENVTIKNVSFKNNTGFGVMVTGPGTIRNVTVDNCKFDNCDRGALLSAHQVVLQNSEMLNFSSATIDRGIVDIADGSSEAIIKNNTFKNSTTSYSNPGIWVQSGRSEINGNIFESIACCGNIFGTHSYFVNNSLSGSTLDAQLLMQGDTADIQNNYVNGYVDRFAFVGGAVGKRYFFSNNKFINGNNSSLAVIHISSGKLYSTNDYISQLPSASGTGVAFGVGTAGEMYIVNPEVENFPDAFTNNSSLATARLYTDITRTGSPEGVIKASIGSRYWRKDGSGSTVAYFKSSGHSDTGWSDISVSGGGGSGDTGVDTYTQLLALTPDDFDTIHVKRYSSSNVEGDGSSQALIYSLNNTGTVDGGFVFPGAGGSLSFDASGVFNGTAGTGRWLALDKDVVNAVRWGVLPTGATGQTGRIQQVITKAATSGRRAYFPTGTYTLERSITIPNGTTDVTVFGDSRNSSIFNFTATDGTNAFNIGDVTFFHMHDLRLNGNSQGGHCLAMVDPAPDSGAFVPQQNSLERLYISGFTGTGKGPDMDNVNGGNPIDVPSCGIFLVQALQTEMADVFVQGCEIGVYGYETNTCTMMRSVSVRNVLAGVVYQFGEANMVSHCNVLGNGLANPHPSGWVELPYAKLGVTDDLGGGIMLIDCWGTAITNNKMKTSSPTQIYTTSDYSPIINGNWIRTDEDTTLKRYGIYGEKAVKITNNIFHPTSGPSAIREQIRMNYPAGRHPGELEIVGNSFTLNAGGVHNAVIRITQNDNTNYPVTGRIAGNYIGADTAPGTALTVTDVFKLENYFGNFTIDNNLVLFNGASITVTDILDLGSVKQSVSIDGGLVVKHNTFTNLFGASTITNSFVGQASGKIRIEGTHRASTGDTTPTVLLTSSLKITSGGTVTDFDDGVDGQEIVVVFDSGTTLRHDGTNIYLNSKQDVKGPAVLEFINDGGLWKEKNVDPDNYEQTLSNAGTVTYDVRRGYHAIMLSPNGATLSNPSNASVGDEGEVIIEGSPSGISFGALWDFGDQTGWTLTTDPGQTDVIRWRKANNNRFYARVYQGFTY